MRGPIDAIISNWLGQRLSGYLSQTTRGGSTAAPADPIKLMACIKPGDVLLVEGQSRVSVAIKYLTQSTWSHAALYVGDETGLVDAQGRPRCFLEADIREGVRAVALSPTKTTQAHVDAIFAVGWTERDLHDAILTVCLFNFMNRLLEGHGVKGSPAVFVDRGRALFEHGYSPLLAMLKTAAQQ